MRKGKERGRDKKTEEEGEEWKAGEGEGVRKWKGVRKKRIKKGNWRKETRKLRRKQQRERDRDDRTEYHTLTDIFYMTKTPFI